MLKFVKTKELAIYSSSKKKCPRTAIPGETILQKLVSKIVQELQEACRTPARSDKQVCKILAYVGKLSVFL